ncbi:MAG TPA: hypothetical protein VFM69_12810 [Pricia sp.]|nr:hypothetical protein [Pricia sp.]
MPSIPSFLLGASSTFDGYIGARAHGDTYNAFRKGGGIIDSITGHGDGFASANFWMGARQPLQVIPCI